MPDTQTPQNALASLIKAAKEAGDGALPVEKWHPEFCGEMDMVIRKDGSWWHEGSQITRAPLVKLFSSVLRKDEDGHHYLVTPAEKIRIRVECAAFMAMRVDVENAGEEQVLFFTLITGEVVELGANHALRVETDADSLEPTPLLHVRGRLEALLMRPVFYELVEYAQEIKTKHGVQLGVKSNGIFFPLGPANIHVGIDSDEAE
ncbi:MAG: hypothetical protein COA43_16305 [Robiginitomaculum sp.]|nr:MAG: hypothetical protein COA43_16305 [Robiginitomaculum sp.]